MQTCISLQDGSYSLRLETKQEWMITVIHLLCNRKLTLESQQSNFKGELVNNCFPGQIWRVRTVSPLERVETQFTERRIIREVWVSVVCLSVCFCGSGARVFLLHYSSNWHNDNPKCGVSWQWFIQNGTPPRLTTC